MTRRTALFLVALLFACDQRPSFSADAIAKAKLLAHAPPGFLLGTATAPHQVEGGLHDDWSEWEKGSYPDGRPHIKDRSTAEVADDSWHRFDQDLAAMESLHANAYRFGVDWSRLEPSEGEWNDAAAAQYLHELDELSAAHITPMVTLYHFTLPLWFAKKGGWLWSGAPAAFAWFAGKAGATFGRRVDLWCTINEANVYAFKSYATGEWPPGDTDTVKMAHVLAALMKAHALAAAALRKNDTFDADGDGKATRIGIAHHVRVFEPASPSALDQVVTAATEAVFNESFPLAVKTGRIEISIPGAVTIDEPVAGLKGSLDWLGLNYYSRDFIRADLSNPSLSVQYTPAARPKNDLGWDEYPEGLYLLLHRFSKYGWPLIVTENGVADAAGNARPAFLRAHLYAVDRALADGVKVEGYFHWSLIDNFEWADGYTAKFGLFSVDMNDPNLVRRPTSAVKVFQEAAANLR